MRENIGDYAEMFKVFCDEARLRILLRLRSGKTCACKLLEDFHFTQPTLSYHMKQLTDSGLVNAEKRGKWVHYSLNGEKMYTLCEFIKELTKSAKDDNGEPFI